MLGIVIPLKARRVARDWQATSAMLQQTLASLGNQTDTNFHHVVVGHDRPKFLTDQSSFVACNFELPPLSAGGSYHRRVDFDRIADKNRKIVRGLQVLQHHPITHWYYLDADDLVHREFVATINDFSPNEAAVVDEGFMLFPRENRVIQHHQLSQVCGSTSVLPASSFQVPSGFENEELAQVPWCRYPHQSMHQCIEDLVGIQLRSIERSLVAYVLGHGDNASDEFRSSPFARAKSWMKPRLLGTRIDNAFRRDFSYFPV